MYTLQCISCGSLVDMRSAKKQATLREHGPQRAMRTHGVRFAPAAFEPGDGCASATCSTDHRRSVFVKCQRKMAAQLLAKERALVAWPRDTGDTDFWRRPLQRAAQTLIAALE